MEEDFLNYIGPADSLSGYSRSYKLVFYKSFLEQMDATGSASAYKVSSQFREYYLSRKQSGKIADKDVDSRIANVENSSVEDVYNIILNNPFKHISDRNFILQRKDSNGKDQFYLSQQLVQELSQDDLKKIRAQVEAKLELYFSGIDQESNNSLHALFNRILDEYVKSKAETFAGHSMGKLFRQDVVDTLYSSIVDQNQYLVKGSVGQGNWATVPWICVFDRSVTTSATHGVYIVYLLSADGKTLYLTLNQGCTDLNKSLGKTEAIKKMREVAEDVISNIECGDFETNGAISLGDNLPELTKLYEAGCICFKKYEQGKVPDNTTLITDLSRMLDLYKQYVRLQNIDTSVPTPIETATSGGDQEMTIKDTVNHIKGYIAAKGFSYIDGLIENFYLSLKSKPFVILAGTSGTGKTRLVKLFAEAIGATSGNGRFRLVSVRPDWSDSSDLFGHVDLNGKFVPGTIIDFVEKAELDLAHPYFLCFDEMNLARVEYYLSDVLSIIETRDFDASGKIISDSLIPSTYFGSDQEAVRKYGTVSLPENLYIIGTVNMDETTFPFSRKVLDRANTIEFSYVDLMPPPYEEHVEDIEALGLPNSFIKAEYLLLNQCADEAAFVDIICSELKEINRILQTANAHVGYRVRDEIVFYMINNKKNDLLSQNAALDNEIIQKILPRIQGSSASIKNMLCDLFKHCAGDYEGYQTENDDISSKMMKVAQNPECKYMQSAKKIAFMVRRYEEDGFTSYWL
ncbi:MAG: DUF3578 domain-containing protein [Bacteroidia bacterium]|nr:DUF3578 domain-containing protein [Bacteroidia bacterium]